MCFLPGGRHYAGLFLFGLLSDAPEKISFPLLHILKNLNIKYIVGCMILVNFRKPLFYALEKI